jgi:hypothetical protein
MAQPDDHLDQARENRALGVMLLADAAGDNTPLQWSVTMAFYAALDALTAHLLRRGVLVTNHQHREAALADPRNGVPHDVYDVYLRLKRRSVGARYDLWSFQPYQVQRLLDGSLKTVLDFVGL